MVNYYVFTLAGIAVALPLNINLGAYSPALVVGDGEISFGGGQDVSNLMNALEGAAVNAAAGATTNAAVAAAPAAVEVPATQATPAETAAVPATATAAAADPTLQEQAQQIAALQGMGKEIAPRVTPADASELPTKAKRDLTGFDRALQYAEAALTKGPKVQLGTGEGGAGVGIIVDNNPTAAARPGTGTEAEAAAAARKKRDVGEAAPKVKVTTMYVRSGVPAAFQSSGELEARDVAGAAVPVVPAAVSVSKQETTLDGINLNVDGNQGVTMTFVETIDEE
ncbi:hypothetical protein NKR23_g5107 [Pleurostoma richardsiae]|uniref:Uncharacterized protein n=1 Tax=Pleurostoma richardsiae TaxID=41990 RepID=A0AA38VR78_9PEZI|nr:hypothetical protein NKR23_g5107 [Pleurostoma richardsiae]